MTLGTDDRENKTSYRLPSHPEPFDGDWRFVAAKPVITVPGRVQCVEYRYIKPWSVLPPHRSWRIDSICRFYKWPFACLLITQPRLRT